MNTEPDLSPNREPTRGSTEVDKSLPSEPAFSALDIGSEYTTYTNLLDPLLKLDSAGDGVFCHFLGRGSEQTLMYSDLYREAARYARYFRASGVEPGQIVFIILRHTPELFYSFLGAMWAGAIPSFLPYRTEKQDPGLYWSSHQKLIQLIDRGFLLTSEENRPLVERHLVLGSARLLTIDEARLESTDFSGPSPSSEQIAFLQHSSGTTGLKKGVCLTHAVVLTQIRHYAEAIRLTSHDCIASWLPLYHDMGLIACFLLPFVTRTPVVMLDPFEWVVNPSLLFTAIRDHRATLCWQPNFAFHLLCRAIRPNASTDLSTMRIWINCSEPCYSETLALFAQAFGAFGVRREQLQVCYAMAETVFAVTQTRPGAIPVVLSAERSIAEQTGKIVPAISGRDTKNFISAGRPVRGTRIRILNTDAQDAPERQIGEISIQAENLFSGYYTRADETARKLRDGWYYTGDLGFIDKGELFITGRNNDLIIVNGRNYYAHDLEYLVNQFSGVHAGRVLALGWFRPEVGSEQIIVIIETAEPDNAMLSRQIKQRLLDEAGLLVHDVFLAPSGWLIKTTSGKINRRENLEKYRKEITKSSIKV